MELVKLNVDEYIKLLGSDAPAPGGGSASALCGAQGAALVSMVARLTVGKKKYAEFDELCKDVAEKATEMQNNFIVQIDKDTNAFNLISEAFKLPKETDEEKAARSKSIADATLVATEVPFETLALSVKGLELLQTIVGKSNTNAASDLGVAALNFVSCAKGSWLNVLINLGGVKDEKKASEFKANGEALIEKAETLAHEVYSTVLNSL